MKFARLLIALVVLSVLVTGCDSEALLEVLLGSEGTPVSPGQPLIVTASPPPPTVIVVTPTPTADAFVATANMNMRYGPGTVYAPPIAVLQEGTPLVVLGKNGNFTGRSLWLYVRTPTGQEGWVAAWLLTVNIDVNPLPILAAPPTPTPVPTDTPSAPTISLTADATVLLPGQCTIIRWNVQNVQAVYFEGVGVPGVGESAQCPATSRTFSLRVIDQGGGESYYAVTLLVGGAPFANFRADRYGLRGGECTTVRWDVTGVSAVYFQGSGVEGQSSQVVCSPGTYSLSVVMPDGTTTHEYRLTIYGI